MAARPDPIALELFKNSIFSIADEMALTVFRTTYSAVLKDNMDYSTAFADGDGRLAAQGLLILVDGCSQIAARGENKSQAGTGKIVPGCGSQRMFPQCHVVFPIPDLFTGSDG